MRQVTKMTYLVFILCATLLSGCGLGGAIGGAVGTVAGTAVDVVL